MYLCYTSAVQQNKKKQVDSKRVFLLGEEPDGAQFALVDQSDGPGVEIVQQPLTHHDVTSDMQIRATDGHLGKAI